MKVTSVVKVGSFLVAVSLFVGCSSYNLRTGNKFDEFVKPDQGQAKVYFLRNDNALAIHPKVIVVKASKGGDMPKPVAFLQKNTFVPVLMSAGDYSFSLSRTSEKVALAPDSTTCVDVSFKYKRISVPAVVVVPASDCRKILSGFDEAVQLAEAKIRIKGEVK
jgi:hypothetical protein